MPDRSPPLFGIETEYAASAVDARGRRLDQGRMLGALMSRAQARLPFLRDEHGSGVFLQNASRFYVDTGGHPELATPECANPCDVVRYVRAGEAILLGLATGAGEETTAFFRTNVDYSGTGSTWGCHGSYMHRTSPAELPPQLIPHLVSRVVLSGAGGFDNTSPGVVFTLSPRAMHLRREVSSDSTYDRGIFHTKDEPLCDGGRHRLHVTFGESLCSDLATWLRVGTTSLVVALCDAGVRPGSPMALRNALAAARTFAGDPSCRARVRTASGRLSAIAIQRHYLEQVEAHLGAPFMPRWAEHVCRGWRDVLGRLEGGWEAVATRLDWAIKLALYRDHVRRRGLTWESLGAWTRVVEQLERALEAKRFGSCRLRADLVLGSSSPIAEETRRLTPVLESLGLRWRGLRPFLETRAELFEIDTRFGQLGPGGLFSALDATGLLEHHVDGVDGIADAADTPPDVPRARLRGQLVRELSGRNGRYRCGWSGVWDLEDGKSVDLSDPFRATLEWKDRGRGPRRRRRLFAGLAARPTVMRDPIALNQAALEHRQLDDLDEAESLLRQAIEIEDATLPPDSPKRSHRRNNLALVLLRAGRLEEAMRINADAWRLKAGRHDLTSARILFVRIALRLLSGASNVRFYLGQLRSLLNRPVLECLGDIDRSWVVPDVFETVYDELGFADAELLLRLARAFDAHPDLSDLDEAVAWHAATAVPLEAPWPEE